MKRPLTPNQWEVLVNLWNESATGIAPLDFGGYNGSHHSNTATSLSRMDPPLVERKKRGYEWGETKQTSGYRMARGSYVYRLTPEGVRIVEEKNPTWAARRKPEAVQP